MLKRLSFLLLFLKRSLAHHSTAWAWFLWSKVLLWQLTFLIDWRHKRLKNTIDLLLFYGEHFYGSLVSDLWKPRKKTYHNKQIYGQRHFYVLWSFILYILQRFVLSLKHNHYAYTPPYMHKTLPTLGNEKEQKQIEFYEKSSGELIFSGATKNLKIIYFTGPTGPTG